MLLPREDEIAACLGADQRGFHRRRRAALRLQGDAARAAAEALARDVAASRALVETRRASVPALRYPAELPIAAQREAIVAAIRDHPVIVVCGDTGSGKSTQLPKMCLEAGLGVRAAIGHTQPRRLAARSVAARLAQETGVELGERVGYKVRFTDRTDPRTLVKVMTDGVLLAEIRRDRTLSAYDCIVVDEAHERSLNVDFLLGYLARLLPHRPDLRVVITSATIDPERFSRHFDDAPIHMVEGRTHPVEQCWRPLPPLEARDLDELDPVFQRGVRDAVRELCELDPPGDPGDVLVFLSGEREIRHTANMLRGALGADAEIVPLFARLSAEEQDRIFAPHAGRRVVLATNVAETSLTVPGIRHVVDGGLARISRYSPRSRVQRLPVERISQASARQRAGRCGRTQPGVCIRLYDEADFEHRDAFTPPEILRTNLASVILQMKSLGLGAIHDFPFLDRPSRAMVREGYATLREIAALDADHELTPLGRRIARFPVDPRLGAMIAAGSSEGALAETLVIATALAVQDPRERPAVRREEADAAHREFADPKSDFLAYLNLWRAWQVEKVARSGGQLRKWCKERFLSFLRMREWQDLHGQLRRIAEREGLVENRQPAPPAAIHRALLHGLLMNVGRRGEGGEYRATGGSTFVISPASSLFRERPNWIMAAEIVETRRRTARCVARIQPDWVETVGHHLLERAWAEPHWDRRRGRVMAWEKVVLGGVEVVERRQAPYDRVDPAVAREIFIQQALVEDDLGAEFPFTRHNRRLLAEVRDIEAKRRRHDVLASHDRRYRFFDERLPKGVRSRASLEQWLMSRRRRDPRALQLRREDAMEPDAPRIDERTFPDALPADGAALPLDYRLDPGADDDGVTVTVPLEALGDLDDRRLEWLVPGRLAELVEALLRALPGEARRRIMPIRERAQALAAALPFGEGDLRARLADALRAHVDVALRPADFDLGRLPDHLRMRVVVTDADGRPIASSRDLAALRRRLADQVRAAIAAHEPDRRLHRDWDFDDLPESREIVRDGLRTAVHPALRDEGHGVRVALLPDADEAARVHRAGVRRLALLRAGDELHEQFDHYPHAEALAEFAQLLPLDAPDWGGLREQLAAMVVDRAVLGDGPAPRTRAAFVAAVERGWNDLWRTGCRTAELALAIIERWYAVRDRLGALRAPAFAGLVRDVEAHLASLLPPGFLVATPPAQLARVPVYLEGVLRRLERLGGGGLARDERAAAELNPRLAALAALAEAGRHAEAARTAAERARWLMEEWRLVLFAPELRPSEPVNARLVDEALAAGAAAR